MYSSNPEFSVSIIYCIKNIILFKENDNSKNTFNSRDLKAITDIGMSGS